MYTTQSYSDLCNNTSWEPMTIEENINNRSAPAECNVVWTKYRSIRSSDLEGRAAEFTNFGNSSTCILANNSNEEAYSRGANFEQPRGKF